MIFTSSYGEIYYEIYGPKDSMAVAFIHGIFADHWLLKKLAIQYQDQYRVILWDMPEHGQSVKLGKDFDFSVTADCFIELLDELGFEKVALVGVSLGGVVGQYIAARYPDRIRGLAVEGAFPLHVNLKKVAFGFRLYSAVVKLIPWRFLLISFKKMTAKMAVDDDLKEYMETVFLEMDKTGLLRMVNGARKGISQGIEKPVQQPVLITHGDREMSMLRKMCAHWHQESPNSEYAVIPSAGHGAVFFNSEEYNQVLRPFLRKLII